MRLFIRQLRPALLVALSREPWACPALLEDRKDAEAINEVGLLEYIDTLDEWRGAEHRCVEDRAAVVAFLRSEGRSTRATSL